MIHGPRGLGADAGHQTGPHLGPMRTRPIHQDSFGLDTQTQGSVTNPYQLWGSEAEMEAERPKAQKPFLGEFRPIRDPVSKTGTPEHPPLLGTHFIQLAGASGNLKIQRRLGVPKQGVPLPASNQLVFLSENLPIP